MHQQKIKTALKNRGLSIRKLCQILKIREASVSEFLSGKNQNIGIPKLEKIMEYLNIGLCDLD